jgi:hypothetical protein
VILDSIPWLGPAIKTYVQLKLEEAQEILLDEISNRGLQALTDLSEEQRDFFVPAAYRFFEQVRLGEYEHNLRVLARLMAGQMVGSNQPDVGRIARAARRLEMMNVESLLCLAVFERAFDFHSREFVTKHPPATLTPRSIYEVLRETGRCRDFEIIFDAMRDLNWRGVIVKLDGYWPPDSEKNVLYQATFAYHEIRDAVVDLC